MQDVGAKVKIKLVSTIRPTDGDMETYELWLEGTVVEKAGSFYLRYEEYVEGAPIRTTVKLGSEQATILRSGEVNMRLPLDVTGEQRGHYESPYGTLPLMTTTTVLTSIHEQQPIRGQFIAQYELVVGEAVAGQYKLEIQYTEGQA